MRKTTAAVTTALLFSLLAGTLLIQNEAKTFIVKGETSDNNTIVDGNTNANVTIQSPENKTYNSNNVTVAFTIESETPPWEFFDGRVLQLFLRHGIVVDYNTSKLVETDLAFQYWNLPEDNVSVTLSSASRNRYVGNATLTGLSQGRHNLTVWIRADTNMISYGIYEWSVFTTVSFNIDLPPHITVLSPQTETYNTSFVPLDFTVSEQSSKIEYSLDGRNNVTISGNTTLAWLANGDHNLTVYAVDETGNTGASGTLTFNVAAPFPLVPVAAAVVVAAAIVAAGLLLYNRKRRKEATQK